METVTVMDWQATGAMVQAVGSVAAILVAVWVDQGAARRAREAASSAQESLGKTRSEALHIAARRAERMKTAVEGSGTADANSDVIIPWVEVRDDMDGLMNARSVLDRFLQGDLGRPALMAAIITARADLDDFFGGTTRGGDWAKSGLLNRLELLCERLSIAIEKARADVL